MASPNWLDWTSITSKDLTDRIEPVGYGLLKKSENLGDGCWCKVCRNIGKYSWLSDYDETKCQGIKLGWHKN
jgi:hypothetical protein